MFSDQALTNRFFRTFIDQSPVAMALFYGPDFIITMANESVLDYWNRTREAVLNKPLFEALPEAAGRGFEELLTGVYTTGKRLVANEPPVDLLRNGQMGRTYIDFVYDPFYETDPATGTEVITGITVTGTEVNGLVTDRKAMEESETLFRSLVAESPVATCLFVGAELVIDVANEGMVRFFGRGPSIVGKPVREVLVGHKDDGLAIALLTEVFDTGEPFTAMSAPAVLTIDGVPGTYYFDLSLKPLRNAAGAVYAVLETATDVTEQVLSRQKLEEAESDLRVAVEVAQLGTWSINAATNGLTYSERVVKWFGHNPGEDDYSRVIPLLDPNDQERVATAVAWALDPRSGGVYNETYAVIHPQTGQKRILHAQGKTVFDATGKAVRLNGTAQDITTQREFQLALENEVQLRTEELATANEELAATNEELAATSEELIISSEKITAANNELLEAVNLLSRSNSNLEKFAYVASHDLQEPLRKIMSFGDLLKSQYADQLGDGAAHLQRMQSSAERMSILIRDLLTYSRISTRQESTEPVALTDIVNTVLADLDLLIEETGAVVTVGPLPTVPGDPLQLWQLVQNLLSNALKFRQADRLPRIRVSAQSVAAADLPSTVKPARPAMTYHRIDVTDNGIGFDEKYVDRIFQVFQRLNGRSQFAGTGIGLAICEKVAANHGGTITASSQPGQGATFSVYLPDSSPAKRYFTL